MPARARIRWPGNRRPFAWAATRRDTAPGRRRGIQAGKRELKQRATDNSIQTAVAQSHSAVARFRVEIGAASVPFQAPDLVDIGKVRGELQRDIDVGGLMSVILNPQLLIAGSEPEELS